MNLLLLLMPFTIISYFNVHGVCIYHLLSVFCSACFEPEKPRSRVHAQNANSSSSNKSVHKKVPGKAILCYFCTFGTFCDVYWVWWSNVTCKHQAKPLQFQGWRRPRWPSQGHLGPQVWNGPGFFERLLVKNSTPLLLCDRTSTRLTEFSRIVYVCILYIYMHIDIHTHMCITHEVCPCAPAKFRRVCQLQQISGQLSVSNQTDCEFSCCETKQYNSVTTCYNKFFLLRWSDRLLFTCTLWYLWQDHLICKHSRYRVGT